MDTVDGVPRCKVPCLTSHSTHDNEESTDIVGYVCYLVWKPWYIAVEARFLFSVVEIDGCGCIAI